MHPSLVSAVVSSTARFEILRVLSGLTSGAGLRQLERLTGCALRSIQVALKGLASEGVVTKVKSGRRLIFRLKEGHSSRAILQEMFAVIQRHELIQRAEHFSRSAGQVLAFVDQMAGMTHGARR